ncbi:MAG: RES family NAD+ phosphorylase [Rhodospirillaceae bacterium]|nr:RES family NAD+ phosphorylase [Rhodospirillaceae bacterium]MYJ72621.1 RES family NAD+ phosphorylase [Rhodospirillaceae bacterium]
MAVRRAGHDLGILDALADLPETVFDGEFWRAVHGARSPLDGSKGAGRWNVRESEVLYCALECDGALSEIFFHINRQQSVFPSRLRSTVHRMRGRFGKAIDLTDMALLERLGVDPARYREIVYGDTQRIGEAVGFLGFEAMLVPNARHPSINLVVFPANCDLDAIERIGAEAVDWAEWRRRPASRDRDEKP